jgi:hypothetical protein
LLTTLGFDIGAGEIGRGVHVRAEADHRNVLVRVGGKRRVDIAVLVHMGVAQSKRQQFVNQHAAEILLLFRRWLRARSGSDWVSMTT